MAGTIEEKIYHRQIFKQFLTNRVLKDPKQQRFFKTNDLYELFSLTEGEKEKTESSAIFAGTGSEIKLGVKKSPKKIPLSDILEDSYAEKKRESSVKRETNKTLYKSSDKNKKKSSERSEEKGNDCNAKIKPSQVEKMKELAKLLSQKIGTTKKSQNESTDLRTAGDALKNEEGKINTGNSNIPSQSNAVEMQLGDNTRVERNEENTDDLVSVNLITVNKQNTERNVVDQTLDSTKNFHTEDVTTSTETSLSHGSMSEDTVKSSSNEAAFDKILEKDKEESKPSESILLRALSVKNDTNERNKEHKWQTDFLGMTSESATEMTQHKSKHKKKDKVKSKEKHKEPHKKGKKFEGERIEYLLKRRKYRKTEEEEKEEKELSKSQDQYVLEKLFRKSGIHGALSHDAIMNSNDPDYLLVEGEAERVAKEALRAVRASRSQCFRPQPSENRMTSLGKKVPKFGKKKSQAFDEIPSAKEKKNKDASHMESKVPMFSGEFIEKLNKEKNNNSNIKEDDGNRPTIPLSSDQGEGSSGMLSSSQLLSRMRQRNKGMTLGSEDEDEGYNPDYPSTATVDEESLEPDVQENIDLLADIRNFVAFQAEIDGQASTQEILSRFQERLPPSQTPFFKALLTSICDFHRDGSGKGIWSLKGEFR